jgi:hypothetical protein
VGLGLLHSGTRHWSWNGDVVDGIMILCLLVHIYGWCIFFATIYMYIHERRNEFMSYVKVEILPNLSGPLTLMMLVMLRLNSRR